MTLNEALRRAEEKYSDEAYRVLAAEVRRLQSDVERLPARRAKPSAKLPPIAPPNLAFFGIVETDEEWSARAGRQVTESAS